MPGRCPKQSVCWQRNWSDVLSEPHLRKILRRCADYYNKIRAHRSLDKDAPAFRSVRRVGNITSYAILGGLHHHYVRISVFGTHSSKPSGCRRSHGPCINARRSDSWSSFVLLNQVERLGPSQPAHVVGEYEER